jgi:hypothetical protein
MQQSLNSGSMGSLTERFLFMHRLRHEVRSPVRLRSPMRSLLRSPVARTKGCS